jgi:ABC-type ATPase with predicted acetyltransferase domain
MQLEGMFDVLPSDVSRVEWDVSVPVEDRDWQVGLIVGPSGSGKSTIAAELFGEALVDEHEWAHDRALVDGFPADMTATQVADTLSRVGFSSPPAWRRPYHVLSTGQKFRADVARAMAENRSGLVVFDEFTSVVDRQVAQIGSSAVGRAVRATPGQQFIAVTCHYDVEEWLQPDWVLRVDEGRFLWRSVQRRPPITLDIRQCDVEAWRLFREHHYLSRTISNSSRCYVAFVDGRPAAFVAMNPWSHVRRGAWQMHRVVCLPDFQGVGIGRRMMDHVAALFLRESGPVYIVTSVRGLARSLARDPKWRMTRKPSRVTSKPGKNMVQKTISRGRLTTTFRYAGSR